MKAWRRGYATRPPQVDTNSIDYPRFEVRYSGLSEAELPRGESLRDVLDRVLPYWKNTVVPELAVGRRVLITAHGNSLRALMKHLEGISDDEIVEVNLPTGVPRAYKLTPDFRSAEACFLGDAAQIEAKIESVQKQARAAS